MARLSATPAIAVTCLLVAGLCFVPPSGPPARPNAVEPRGSLAQPSSHDFKAMAIADVSSTFGGALRFLAGVVLGALLLGTATSPARADIEDVAVPVDGKGKTTTLTREQLVRGKRLFLAACSSCHVGGGNRTNQNVGLALEELSGAQPSRGSIDGIVDYLNSPTTYDGLRDISETHPSIKSADLFPKMRSMKQQDLYDMSAYILYMNFTIPEKWGGGKQYY